MASGKVRNGRIGLGGFIGLTLLSVLLAFVATTILPHDPYIRYQSFRGTIFERLNWIYERLHYDNTPVDILFVGSSRTARGVDPEQLEAMMADRGFDLHAANISLPASGIDIRMTEIAEAVRAKDIRLIVIGLSEALPRDGHQAFGDLATAGEILASPWLLNRNLAPNLAGLPYRQMELAVATALPEAFGYHRKFEPSAYFGTTPDLRVLNDADMANEDDATQLATEEHAEAMAGESRMRRRQITSPILPENLAWIEFGVSRSYIRRIAELARREGIELAFVFLPFFDGYDAPMDENFILNYGPLWKADFIKSDPRNYIDAGHVSPKGRDLVAPWLVDHILSFMEDK